MPDRRQPGSGWYILAYLFAATAGLVGVLAAPSVSVRVALEGARLGWAIDVWSLGFLGVGVASIIARAMRWYCAEVWAVVALSGMFWLWAALVAAAGTGTAWQAGLGFACTGAFMTGWARYRRYRLRRNATSVERLRQAVDETVGEALRRDREA